MKLIIGNDVQDKLDALIDEAQAAGKTVRRIVLDREERHQLYSTGQVDKWPSFYGEPRGRYRGIEIFAEEEVS